MRDPKWVAIVEFTIYVFYSLFAFSFVFVLGASRVQRQGSAPGTLTANSIPYLGVVSVQPRLKGAPDTCRLNLSNDSGG